jgi:thiamine pyrophosphokinase
MHALVVGASPEPRGERFYTDLLAAADRVFAADAGGEWCVALGRVPDHAVGDFDSAEPGAPDRLRAAGVRVVEYAAAKDESDLDLALAAALADGADGITLTACSGGRLAHALASLGTLLRATGLAAADVQEPSFVAWAVQGPPAMQLGISVEPGTLFSVMAVGDATGVSVTGGAFHLADAALPPLSSLGLSNVAVSHYVAVSVRSGRLMLIAETAAESPRPSLIPTP